MDQQIAEAPPTSTAATSETELEVVAGISSAEGNPDQPLSFRVAGFEIPYGRLAMLLAGGLVLGWGIGRWVMRRDR
jgi:hypothetical protein